MSVIISRALPDIRDGLKPVHRRILYAMHKGGFDWTKQFRKSARIVGDVIGKYHPHGDQSVYDALVRMVQDFSMSLPLIQGYNSSLTMLGGGNQNSIPSQDNKQSFDDSSMAQNELDDDIPF